jgi:peptidoglycan/LPS O-acetylase OafA/YrhL
VGFFFVLSGFVLAYNYHDWFSGGLGRAGPFLWQRVARIYPLAVLALLLMTPVSLLSLGRLGDLAPALDGPTLAASWLANALQAQAFWPTPAVMLVWNDPAWSISAEMAFYCALPAFLWGVVRPCAQRRRLGLLALGLVAAQLGLLTLAAPLGRDGPLLPGLTFDQFDEFIYKSPVFRVWEFLLGATLGAAVLEARRGARGPLAGLVAAGRARHALLAAAALGLLAVTAGPRLPGWRATPHLEEWTWYGLTTPLWLLLIAALAAGPTLLTRWLERGWLVLLGEASYALYLLHWIPLSLLIWATAGGRPPAPVSLAALGATLLAVLACYRWVERPSRAWLRARPLPSALGWGGGARRAGRRRPPAAREDGPRVEGGPHG